MKKKITLLILATVVILLSVMAFAFLRPLFNGGIVFECDFDKNQRKALKLLRGNAEIVSDAGLTGAGLFLDGDASYMMLPRNILKRKMTVIIWVKRDASFGYERIFDFGCDRDNYFYLSPANGSCEIAVDGDKNWIGMPASKTVGEWQMFAVSANDNEFSVFYNGAKKGDARKAKYSLCDVRDTENYIGKSRFDDPYLKGVVDDIVIYNRALSEEEIKSIYDKGMAMLRLKEEAKKLTLPDHLYEDLDISEATEHIDTDVRFISSDKKALSPEGKITQGKKDLDVKFTAVLSDKATGASFEKEFVITVVAEGAKGRLEYIKKHLDIGISYAFDDIILPSEIDGATVKWEANDFITKEGKLMKAEKDTKTLLKATVSYLGESVEGEIDITVAGKTKGYLLTSTSLYEYNTGVEFAEFPSHSYTDNARTDVMFYAVSEDGKAFKGLNNDRAVLYPYSDECVFGTPFKYKFASPSLFRKPDGSYGLVAVNDCQESEIMLYDSSDLINFSGQRTVDLRMPVSDPEIRYDNSKKSFVLYFCNENGSFAAYSYDLISFSEPMPCDYKKSVTDAELPVYIDRGGSSVFELTSDEYERIMKKYGGLKSVAVEYEKEITSKAGKAFELPDTATVIYNDGSEKKMGIIWDTASAGLDLSSPAAGTYTVSGIIDRPVYESPLAECRADPYVIYNDKDNMYYFTSSYMQPDCQNAYSYVILRRASTINGLKTAEEVAIWDSSRGNAKAWYWAPELHYFGGQWRMILLSTWEGSGWEATLLSCKKDGDLMDPMNWSAEIIGGDPNGKKLGAFDSTFFEYGGKSYYVTPSGNNIWIAEFDPYKPLEIKTELVKIGGASYAWEYNNGYPGTICDHQYVNEASSIMIRNGRIYLTYAGSTIDMHYCIGLLYADLNDDIMDPSSWHKHPLPLLVTADLTTTLKEPVIGEDGDTIEDGEYEGSFGPGHNSITYDKYGNPVVIYHARVWGEHFVSSGEQYGLGDPGRHAFAHSVNFDIDGIPVMNLSPEDELSKELEKVTITVVVK